MSLSPVSSPPSSPGYSSSPNDSDDSVCFTTTQPRRTGTTKGTGTTVNKRKLRYSRRDTLILPREALKEVNGSKVDVSSTTSSPLTLSKPASPSPASINSSRSPFPKSPLSRPPTSTASPPLTTPTTDQENLSAVSTPLRLLSAFLDGRPTPSAATTRPAERGQRYSATPRTIGYARDVFLKADFEEMRNEARLEKSGRVLLEVEEEERELSDEEVVEQRWDGTPEEYYEQVGMDGARQELYEDEEEDGIESEQEDLPLSSPTHRDSASISSPHFARPPAQHLDSSFVATRHSQAIGYDSDELTDADAEGSYEVFSDDEVVEEEQEEVEEDVLVRLEGLTVGDELTEESEVELEEQEQEEFESLVSDSEVEPVSSLVDESEPERSDVELSTTEEELDSEDEEEVLGDGKDDDVTVMPSGGLSTLVPDDTDSSLSAAGEVPTTSEDLPEATLASPAPTPIRPTSTTVLPSPIASTPSTRTPARTTTTPSSTSAATPSITTTKRQTLMTAPTAKRQLTKLSSKSSTSLKPPSSTSSSLDDNKKCLSNVVPSSALPGQRRLGGIPRSALPKRASPPSAPALRATGLPKPPSSSSAAPSSSSTVLPPPAASRAKPLSSTTSPVKAPSRLVRPAGTTSTLPSRAPARSTITSSIRSGTKTSDSSDGRPSSAASSTSSTTAPTATLARPRPLIKSLKPPSTSNGSTLKAPIGRSVPTSTTATGLARRTLPVSAAVAARSASAPTTTTTSVRPTSSLPSLATRTGSVNVPTANTVAPPTSTRPTLAPPTSLLSRPPSAPPSALPARRLLPSLAQTNSAPSVLGPTVAPLPPPVPTPSTSTQASASLPLPLLPRPVASSNLTSRSPEKKAQRVIRDVPASSVKRQVQTDSENVRPTTIAPSASTTSLSSQQSSTSSSSSSLYRPALLPPPSSPVKTKPLPFPTVVVPPPVVSSTSSALTAPPEKLDTALDLFAPIVSAPLPPPPAPLPLLPPPTRSTRATRTKPTLDDPIPVPDPTPIAILAPLPRPTRRQPVVVVPTPPSPPPAPTTPAPSRTARPLPTFTPAPSLTTEELSRLTQKNTKRNQLHFNKLDIQTIYLDSNRPPSPTSKVRRSLGGEGSLGRPTTKEGREERAKKRRGALRSSMDGSEEALLKGEMGEDEDGEREKVVAKVHYRAPGDEEEFFSPVRNAVVVSKGKSGGKKKSETMAAAMVVSGERKRVKWDKALVYEGPLEVRAESVDGILKRVPLDTFGNSTSTTSGFAKAIPVQIMKLVYKDDVE